MPDVAEQLRLSAAAEAASYEPSPELPRRIARRTLQLQRQRRTRVVGGAAVLAAAMLAFTLVVRPTTSSSNSVSIAAGPVNLAAKNADESTVSSTTTTTAQLQLLDLQAFIDHGIQVRNDAIKKFAAEVKKRQRAAEIAANGRDGEVLDASIARGPSVHNDAPATGINPTPSSTTRPPDTTSTTDAPTTTTTTTVPIIPLTIVAPDHVCAGVPAVFRATGTGAEQVQWSNGLTGATTTYVLAASTTISARLDLGGSVSSQAYGVQVIPTGTPPC